MLKDVDSVSELAPPTFQQTPPPVAEVRLGDPLTLVCSAYGNPEPKITWRKDGATLQGQEKYQVSNGTVRIRATDRSSRGVYTCHASSEEGNATHTTRLLVQGPPVIVVPPENVTVNVSHDAFFTCQAEAYPHNLTYSWFKGDANVYRFSELQSRVQILVDGSLLMKQTAPQDSGKYTCIPSNGILAPPSASAYLSVLHPARVIDMPPVTFLPIGMEGMIRCPVQAEPPLLIVNWTKDGRPLELEKLPGWFLKEDGTVVIATSNDDALGVYTCTPYNNYGTMGESSPTQVVLKEPPVFKVTPKSEYLQEMGRELTIPCSATGDPIPSITWKKLGKAGRGSYRVDGNGSLVFTLLSKEHHGVWECVAQNSVAQISAWTSVLVLGTSPHAPENVSVQPLITSANVTWDAGFDGGYTQRFSVWYTPVLKRLARGQHEWRSSFVPLGESSFLVENLRPRTGYQFSVLSQNKLGSGPFSPIITAFTQPVPTTTVAPEIPPTEPPNFLPPPAFLLANETSQGVVLLWEAPLGHMGTVLSYLLKYRQDNGEWEVLDDSIPGSLTQLLVQGLMKDSLYEFQLFAVGEHFVSDSSNIVNVSTAGMEVYPSRTQLTDYFSQPVLAGIIAGICFLSTAIIFSTLVACFMNRRRALRRQKRQHDSPPAFPHSKKTPPPQNSKGSSSPDSVIKFKLQTANYNSFNKTALWEEKGSNSSRSSKESRGAGKSKYTVYESHIGAFTPLESISRGSDGRFVVQNDESEELKMDKKIEEFSYVRETDVYPEFHRAEQESVYSLVDMPVSSQSYSSGQDPYLQVSLSSEGRPDVWQKEVAMRPRATGQARREARASGYRQGRYFGYGSSSPMEEARPLCIKDISPVTSTATLPISSVKEQPRDATVLEENLAGTISTLQASEKKASSSLSSLIGSPFSFPKPSGLHSHTSQYLTSQTAESRILQYLSMPYFKEMNVDGDSSDENSQNGSKTDLPTQGEKGGILVVPQDSFKPSVGPKPQAFLSCRNILEMEPKPSEHRGLKGPEKTSMLHRLSCPDHIDEKAIEIAPKENTKVVSLLKPPEQKWWPLKAALPRGLSWPGHVTEPTSQLSAEEHTKRRDELSPAQVLRGKEIETLYLGVSRKLSWSESLKQRPYQGLPEQVTQARHGLISFDKPQATTFLRGSPSERLLRTSITSQSSGRGSVSFARPSSLSQSSGSYMGLPASDSTEYSGRNCPLSLTGEETRNSSSTASSNRRELSVDENYEWDTEFTVESEVLDALKLYKSGKTNRPVSTIAIQDLERQGLASSPVDYSRPVSTGSVDALNFTSAEARCAALKEEFLEYRRRREEEEQTLLSGMDYDESFEQATLL
nr:PREDICTED: protein turtle homolog A-like [Latimeria chalumnae]|eukprot:XP_014343555.1 PREDICTED: protein turtle homolog A-like [Latimeria chalumnae]